MDYSKSKPFHGVSGKPEVKEIIPALGLKRSSAICWPLSSLVSLSAVRFVGQSGLCHGTLQSNDDQHTLKAQGQAEGRKNILYKPTLCSHDSIYLSILKNIYQIYCMFFVGKKKKKSYTLH